MSDKTQEQFDETAAELLRQYRSLILSSANEAETRLKLIDQIIFSVLGWTHDDVRVEHRASEDRKTYFIDYVLHTANTSLIVEAKRVGATFSEVPNVRRSKLNGQILEGDVGKHIHQVRDYARSASIPFAAITNGSSWIVFPALRVDQVAFSESAALIFPDLGSVLSTNFGEFSDLLSRDAVIGGSLEVSLLGRMENQFIERRLNQRYTSTFSRHRRQNLFTLIQDQLHVALSEDIVAQDSNILAKCYVPTADRTRFDNRLRMYVGRHDPARARPSIHPLRADSNPIVPILASAHKTTRPIAYMVLGPVGSGKTTFLNFTRLVSGAELFAARSDRPYPYWFYVDFRTFARVESPSKFLFRRIFEFIVVFLSLSMKIYSCRTTNVV